MKKLVIVLSILAFAGSVQAKRFWRREQKAVSIQDLIDDKKLPAVGFDSRLDLRGLHINSLEGLKNIPGKESITTLNLSNNELSKISGNAFEGFTNLWALVLSNNKIKDIDDEAFAGLNLKWLWLNNNQLKEVENWFKGVNQQKYQVVLDFSSNKIITVKKDALKELIPPKSGTHARLQAVILKGNPDIAFPAGLLKKLEEENSVRVILPQEARARSLGATKTPLSTRESRLKQLRRALGVPLIHQQPTEPLSE